MQKLKITWRRFVQVFFGCKLWGMPIANRIRKAVYKRTFGLGQVDVIGNNVQLSVPHGITGTIEVGDHVILCDDVQIDLTGNVILEDYASLSRRTTVYSHGHDFEKLAAREGGDVITGNVKVCEGAWIGDNVIILPNIIIGEKAVVGAGSIVTKDVPPHTIVAGNPAKVIRDHYDEK